MKKFLFLFAAMLVHPAAAAALPGKAQVAAPSGIWSGLYFGVNGAGAKMSSHFNDVVAKELLIPGTGDLHPSGALAGVTAGAGFWNGGLYLGLEADGDYDFSKSKTTCMFELSCRVKSGFLFTERVVVGGTLGGITGAAVARGATAPSNWPVPVSGPNSIYAAQIMPFATAGVAP